MGGVAPLHSAELRWGLGVEEEDPWVKYNTDYVIASFYYWICGGGWFVVGRI